MDLQSMSEGVQVRDAPEYALPYRLKDAPDGWVLIPGFPMWQVVPDPATPWDPAVVRAMRELDPNIVPLWATWAYRPPCRDSSVEVFVTGRHAVGWHLPEAESQDFQVLMPTGPIHGLSFKRPTRLWKIYHEAPEGDEERIGGFVSWSWWQYHNMREEFSERGHQTMREYLRGMRAGQEVRKAARDAQHQYMMSQVAPFIQKRLDNVRPLDWKLWQAGGWKTARPQSTSISLSGAYPQQ